MRIVLLGHRDIASLLALHRLVTLSADHEYITFFSDGAFSANTAPVPELETLAADDAALVSRWVDGGFGVPPAEALSLDSPQILNAPNSTEGVTQLEALRPDLVVSIRYRRILKDAAIAVPRLGVINVHSGPLPEYRGVMATFWAMLNGEREIGTTIHRIVDGGIDTGPIIDRLIQPVDIQRSYLANVISLYRPACDRLSAVITARCNGESVESRSQTTGGSYYTMPGVEDINRFKSAGYRLSDATDADCVTQHLDAQVQKVSKTTNGGGPVTASKWPDTF
ncbi:MAG: formyl transferase [Pseudomonadota bacterium]